MCCRLNQLNAFVKLWQIQRHPDEAIIWQNTVSPKDFQVNSLKNEKKSKESQTNVQILLATAVWWKSHRCEHLHNNTKTGFKACKIIMLWSIPSRSAESSADRRSMEVIEQRGSHAISSYTFPELLCIIAWWEAESHLNRPSAPSYVGSSS